MSQTLKARLRSNKTTIGSWITIGDCSVAEIMAKSGFNWLAIDMEHSAITLDIAQKLLQVTQLSGVTTLVRVGANEPNLIKRVMDAGSDGVIVPMVSTKEDAVKAVSAVKYPPAGRRGVGLARAQGYGLKFAEYKKWLAKESVVIVQIEDARGVENLPDILSVDGVDAFMVGPYDLSASLGQPGNFDTPKMRSALRRVIEISRKMRVPAGFHVVEPDIGLLQRKVREGYKFVAFGFDALILGRSCEGHLSGIRKIL